MMAPFGKDENWPVVASITCALFTGAARQWMAWKESGTDGHRVKLARHRKRADTTTNERERVGRLGGNRRVWTASSSSAAAASSDLDLHRTEIVAIDGSLRLIVLLNVHQKSQWIKRIIISERCHEHTFSFAIDDHASTDWAVKKRALRRRAPKECQMCTLVESHPNIN